MIQRIWTLTVARTKEFYRDRSALGWNILFPFFIIIGFSFIFNQDEQVLYKVGIIKTEKSAVAVQSGKFRKQFNDFKEYKFIDFVNFSSKPDALDRLNHHRVDFILDPGEGKYWVNKTSPKGYIVEKLFLSANRENNTYFRRQYTAEREVPYIEWLFPGILGMNVMFSALFGVGYVVVRYRKNGVLKRMSVTPVRTFEFLSSQIISRMFAIIVTTVLVYVGCSLLYGFECKGSYFTLLLAFSIGSFSMVSIGLVVASRSSSEEFAGGVLNLISWPMMFLSEVWFSLEGANPWIQTVSKLFPLTHMIDSARKIMNDGATIVDVAPQLFIMSMMSLVFITLSSLLFKWQKDS